MVKPRRRRGLMFFCKNFFITGQIRKLIAICNVYPFDREESANNFFILNHFKNSTKFPSSKILKSPAFTTLPSSMKTNNGNFPYVIAINSGAGIFQC